MREPRRRSSSRYLNDPDGRSREGRVCPGTELTQERGERLDTGRAIARGEKTSGGVPGAAGRDETENNQEAARPA